MRRGELTNYDISKPGPLISRCSQNKQQHENPTLNSNLKTIVSQINANPCPQNAMHYRLRLPGIAMPVSCSSIQGYLNVRQTVRLSPYHVNFVRMRPLNIVRVSEIVASLFVTLRRGSAVWVVVALRMLYCVGINRFKGESVVGPG